MSLLLARRCGSSHQPASLPVLLGLHLGQGPGEGVGGAKCCSRKAVKSKRWDMVACRRLFSGGGGRGEHGGNKRDERSEGRAGGGAGKGAVGGDMFEAAFGAGAAAGFPAFMRRFHTVGGTVQGAFTVTRGTGALANLFATLGGLPRAATGVPISVHSFRTGGGSGALTWERSFGGELGDKLISEITFDSHSGLMQEKFYRFGLPISFTFKLLPIRATDTGIDTDAGMGGGGGMGFLHKTEGMRVLGLPIPCPLQLTADGASVALSEGGGWSVSVEVIAPLIGRLVKYEGNVFPSSDKQAGIC